MQTNPYSPPIANVERGSNDVAVRRPIAVWLLEIFLAIMLGLFLTGLFQAIMNGDAQRTAQLNPIRLAVGIACVLALMAVVATLVSCLHRGLRFSRWVGVVVIAAFGAYCVFRVDTTHYANDAERAGGFAGHYLVMLPLFVYWIHALAFSAKARQYFGRSGRV